MLNDARATASMSARAREWLLPSRTMKQRSLGPAIGLVYVALIGVAGGLRIDHVLIGSLGLLEAGLDPRLTLVGSRKPLEVVVPRVPSLYRCAGPLGSPLGGYYLIWLCPTCLNVGRKHAIFPIKKTRSASSMKRSNSS